MSSVPKLGQSRGRTAAVVPAVGLCLLLAAVPLAAMAASSLPVRVAPKAARDTRGPVVRIRLATMAGARCRLVLRPQRRTRTFTARLSSRPLSVPHSGWALIRMPLPVSAPAGLWSVTATCEDGGLTGRAVARVRLVKSARVRDGIPRSRHALPQPKPVPDIGGGIPADQYLPFATGARVRVSQGAQAPCGFGYDHAPTRCNPYYGPYNQYAWDFAVGSGTPVHAAVGGLVLRAGFQTGGYGNTVVIQTSRGDCSRYEHLSSIDVRVGQSVATYALIGKSGATGHVTGPHLHYGREDCHTARSLQSSFLDVGDPRMGSAVTSGNHPDAGAPSPAPAPVGCPPNCSVYGAAGGVNVREAPSSSAPVLSLLANGSQVAIACQTTGDAVGGSRIWDRLAGGGYMSDYYVNTPVTGAFSPGIPQCPSPAPGPAPGPPGPAPGNRQAITSYNRTAPGAPYHGQFAFAYQAFNAASNRITTLGVTVGNIRYTPGGVAPANVNIRLCTNRPDGAGNCDAIAQASPQVVNYGDSQGDVGDVAVTPGVTYWVVYFSPQPYGNGWVTYWWAGGSSIGLSDQMQMVVRG